jgi:hypothetical protein
VRRFQRRGWDLNIIPSMGTRVAKTKMPHVVCGILSGEGGI